MADARPPVPIVGVGASAGGLEAFSELLRHLPADTGMAFVLIQHLDPRHDSALPQLLGRASAMPVQRVDQEMTLDPNHVYVIAPDTSLSLVNGRLEPEKRDTTQSPHHPIDVFFESLAAHSQARAIGIVLSGTASDGTVGLEAIKAESGITFAQDASARYDSMPRSAVSAGCVDFVLSPERIAQELVRIANHPHVVGATVETAGASDRETGPDASEEGEAREISGGQTEPEADAYRTVLTLLHRHSGVDFSYYKSNTIRRRISRRMALGKHLSLAEYAPRLRDDERELEALYSDLLINVTSFFRNPEAFDFLKHQVLPRLVPSQRDGPVRMWTLGCSTGQEAYSLAMTFAEFADTLSWTPKLQLFATDLNNTLLGQARAGLYPLSAVSDVSPERLRRFFVREDGGYRIAKWLRDSVVCARQNLLDDPPFSRLDLVSCRNMLIYLDRRVQQKAIPTFHYALRPEGCLFLGASESIGTFTDLFEPLDKKLRIYSRKPGPSSVLTARLTPGKVVNDERMRTQPAAAPQGVHTELNVQREADRLTRTRYAPPSVLIDPEWQVIEFRGDTSAYLAQPSGKASFDLLDMSRDGVRVPLKAILSKARKDGHASRKEATAIDEAGNRRKVHIEVVPLKHAETQCYLVFFEDSIEGAAVTGAGASRVLPSRRRNRKPTGDERTRIRELEEELSETRDYLQSLREQHEAAHEELQASNEEVTSANEELQSMNEELETSTEELESANEELITVNEEMTNRNTELDRLNSDLVNLQVSTRLSVLLLGRDLRIRRFSERAAKQFDLQAGDIGRPIRHLQHHLDFAPTDSDDASLEELEPLLAEVISEVSEREREVRGLDGRWYVLRARPYMTSDNKVDGAILVLVDVDALKRTARDVRAARDYAEAIVRMAPDPLLVLTHDFTVEAVNEAFSQSFNLPAQDALGRNVFALGNGQWNIPELRELLELILPRDRVLANYEVTRDFPGLGRRTIVLNASVLRDGDEHAERILLGMKDITELMQVREAGRRADQRYRRLFDGATDGLLLVDPDTQQIVESNPVASVLLGLDHDALLGKQLFETGLFKSDLASQEAFRQLRRDGVFHSGTLLLAPASDRSRSVELELELHAEEGGHVVQCRVRDLSEQVRAQELERRSVQQSLQIANAFAQLTEQAPYGVYVVDATLRIRQVNDGAQLVFQNVRPLIGHDFAEAIHTIWPEPMASDVLRIFQHTLETGAPYISPGFTSPRRDLNRVESYEWQTHRITLPDGEYGVVCYFFDATRMREAAEQVRESDLRYRELVAQVRDFAIFRTDLAGAPTTWNEGVERVLGYTEAEFIGADVSTEIFTPADVQAEVPQGELARAAADGASGGDRWMRRKDGTKFFSTGVTTALRDESGALIGFTMVMRDQTDRWRIEEVAKQHAVDLADTDRRKNEFLAVLAHELRNPLAPIRNGAQVLRDAAEDLDAVRSVSAMIERQISQLVRLVDDLLEVSRINQGKVSLRRERVPVEPIVRQAFEAAMASPLSQEREFTLSLPPEPLYLFADAVRLMQVVGNLINNALKFTSPGGRISLVVERELAHASIRVRDDGIGVLAEDLPRLFDMFVQVDTSLDRSNGGLGLGLTLARNLVEMHDGTVEALSAGAGQGSEFVVRLPLDPEPTHMLPEPVAAATRHASLPRRILVVDDNADAASTLALLLSLNGHETHTANDGMTALAMTEAIRPEVVLLDIGLPRMNGYEVARRIRTAAWGQDVLLVALTGWGQDDDRRKSRDAGFDAHLVKPVLHTELEKLFVKLSAETP